MACAKLSSEKRSYNSKSDLSLDQIAPTTVMTMIVLLEHPKKEKMRFVLFLLLLFSKNQLKSSITVRLTVIQIQILLLCCFLAHSCVIVHWNIFHAIMSTFRLFSNGRLCNYGLVMLLLSLPKKKKEWHAVYGIGFPYLKIFNENDCVYAYTRRKNNNLNFFHYYILPSCK